MISAMNLGLVVIGGDCARFSARECALWIVRARGCTRMREHMRLCEPIQTPNKFCPLIHASFRRF